MTSSLVAWKFLVVLTLMKMSSSVVWTLAVAVVGGWVVTGIGEASSGCSWMPLPRSSVMLSSATDLKDLSGQKPTNVLIHGWLSVCSDKTTGELLAKVRMTARVENENSTTIKKADRILLRVSRIFDTWQLIFFRWSLKKDNQGSIWEQEQSTCLIVSYCLKELTTHVIQTLLLVSEEKCTKHNRPWLRRDWRIWSKTPKGAETLCIVLPTWP